MTRDDARLDAKAVAISTGKPAHIWEHIGGSNAKGKILPQGRFVVTRDDEPAPKHVWSKVETIQPGA